MTPDSPAITFRPLVRDDLPMFAEWLTRPHVAEWWDTPSSTGDVAAEYATELDGTSTTRVYVALADGAPVGFIQSYVVMGSGDGWWEDEQDPGARGIDQFIANAEQLGQGLGTAMVRAFVARLLEDPAVTRVQTDPDPRNGRAVRCYEKAGFRPLGVVDTPDGKALLMVIER